MASQIAQIAQTTQTAKGNLNPYVCGEGIISKIVKPVPNTDIRELCLTEAYDKINKIVVDTFFTSMYIGLCSFTNQIYEEDDVFCRYIRGCANTHKIPGGMIQSSKEAEHFLECCNMCHNIRNLLFPVCFTDLHNDVKVPRSSKGNNGELKVSDGNITENSAIWRSKSRDCLHIKVEFGGPLERFQKSVSLKSLMEVNNVKSISINPRVYGDDYISRQPDNTQRLFNFFNQKYRDFLAEEIIPEFERENIPFTVEYKEFDFTQPVIY